MPLRFTCPRCQSSYSVDDELRGKKVRCRECDRPVAIPPAPPAGTKKNEEGVYDPTGKSAPVRTPRRPNRDEEDDDRPMRRADRGRDDDDDEPRRNKENAKKSMTPMLLLGCGGAAVLGVVGLVVGLGIFFLVRTPAAPDQPVAFNNAAPPVMQPPVVQPPVFQPAQPPAVPNGNPQPNVDPGPAVKPAPALGQIDQATREKVKRSTVYLRVTMPNGSVAEGSGFLAIEPGIIITNAHVLGMLRAQSIPPANVDVVVHSGEPGQQVLRGHVAGVDRATDLAIVRVPAPGLPPPLSIDSARNVTELQKVYFFGYPFGKQLGSNITVSEGQISSLRKDPTGAINQVQLNGDMQPGNSGGPVVDSAGRVIGVAVAIIRGTRINFAVPADAIKPILDGRVAETRVGEPFMDNHQVKVPVKVQCLDPLGKVKSLRVEVWSGNPGPPRSSTTQKPLVQAGDGPRQSTVVNVQNGAALADVPLPTLAAGQAYWVQPVVVNGAGATEWGQAIALVSSVPLQRIPANLTMKFEETGQERSINLKDSMRFKMFAPGKELTESSEFEADLLEVLTKTAKGPDLRLTIGPNRFTEGTNGNVVASPELMTKALRDFSPNFLVEANGKFNLRTTPRPNPKLAKEKRDEFDSMLGRICNAYEQLLIYVPNGPVNPQQSFDAKVVTIVGKGVKREVWDVVLTCTYEGTRIDSGRAEAFIRLSGLVKGRGKTEQMTKGKVSGVALFDTEAGFFSQINMKINSEAEFGPIQAVVTEEISVRRAAGNPLNIVAFKPRPAGPMAGKVILNVTGQLAATDAMDPMKAGARYKPQEVMLEAGKTYIIDMKQAPGSAIDPYLKLFDPNKTLAGQDDNNGGGLDARIVITPPSAGRYQIWATSPLANQFGPYVLTVAEAIVAPNQPNPNEAAGPSQLLATYQGSLTPKTASDPSAPGRRYRFQDVTFVAGKTYVIEMKQRPGSSLDPLLKLLDPTGKLVASDDNGGGGVNARIAFTAPQNGVYRIIATTTQPNAYGSYVLTVSGKL